MNPTTIAKRLFMLVALLGLLLAGATPAGAGSIWYVKATGTSANTCADWANACDLQTAIGKAGSSDQIWVAAGTYKPGTSRSDSFNLKNGVAIFGGFPASGTPIWADRHPGVDAPESYKTYLTGDLIGNDAPTWTNRDDNSFHVVQANGTNGTAILDGFTIKGGYSGGTNGGGMLVGSGSPSVSNVLITDNSVGGSAPGGYGAGMYVSSGSPVVANVAFRGNMGANMGGGIYVGGGSPALSNVTFTGNYANTGGGMYVQSGNPTLDNVTLSGNQAQSYGITELDVWVDGNSVPLGTVTIRNSIVDGGNRLPAGSTATHSAFPLFGGPTGSNGNITLTGSPFVSSTDLHLVAGSALIDAGDSSLLPADAADLDRDGNTTEKLPRDMDNKLRFVEDPSKADTGSGPRPIVDMGAYEYQGTNNTAPAVDTGVDATIKEGETFTRSGSFADPDANSWTGTVNYGDGSGDQTLALSADRSFSLSHVYATPGAYTLTVSVSDGTVIGMDSVLVTVNSYPVIYVKWNAPGSNNGTSWTNAYRDLQSALSAATSGQHIWVAAGTYKPTIPAGRDATFTLKNGVAIYGGFAGTETARSQRNWATNVTTLSGVVYVSGVPDKAYHVVTSPSGADGTSVLDGFTITDGSADGTRQGGGMYVAGSPTLSNLTVSGNSAYAGGGMYVAGGSPVLTDVTFDSNTAGTGNGGGANVSSGSPRMTRVSFTNNSLGVYAYGGGMFATGSPLLTDVTFSGNHADAGIGGGLYAGGATVIGGTFSGNTARGAGGMYAYGTTKLSNVTFTDNSAYRSDGPTAGGGLWNDAGAATLINVAFSGNTAGTTAAWNTTGGGLYNNSGATATLTNVTFSRNQATGGVGNDASKGGGIYNWGTLTLTNSIMWGNSAPYPGYDTSWQQIYPGGTTNVSYSDVQGGCTSWSGVLICGTGNINADPLLVDAVNDDLHLQPGSHAIDAGSNAPFETGGVAAEVTTDLGGSPRKVDGPDADATATVDMGAYESQVGPDTIAPTGSISISAGAGYTGVTGVTLTLAATDNVWTVTDIDMRLSNTSDFATATWEHFATSKAWTLSGGDGEKTVYAQFKDGAGNASGTYSDTIILDTGAVTLSLTAPANSSSTFDTTPTFSGTAGRAPGDSATVTVKVYSGGTASGTPVQTLSATLDVGTGAYSVDASPALTPGAHTARAEQLDGAGNTGYSTANTFSVGVIYVDATPSGTGNNGSNWTNAYTDLQSALAAANPAAGETVQIWVAGGTYKPSSPAGRDATFALKNGVAIYGGFAGTESLLSQRNLAVTANASALNGDLDGSGTLSGLDAYHVVSAAGTVTSTAILDGFTITGGNAEGSWPTGTGGGMYNEGSPTLRNLIFAWNHGNQGGGMYNNGSPTLANSVFWKNTAGWGGGVSSNGGSPALVNVTLSGNSAAIAGGMYVTGGTPTLTNSVVWGNTPSASQIAGTATVSYSAVEGGYTGDHIVAANPLFVDAAGGNLRLQAHSSAIDAGNNSAVPGGIDKDLAGNPRFRNDPGTGDTGSGTAPIVDMGAYEFQGVSGVATGTIYVKKTATGLNDGTSWTNAFTSIESALTVANPGSGQSVEIWVAKDTYYPSARVPAESDDARTATFTLKNGVKLYGGFLGVDTEINLSQRDWTANPTILHGGTVYHVVTAPTGTDSSAVLDGFTVRGGRAGNVATDLISSGGGMLVRGSPTVANVVFNDNQAIIYTAGAAGGGMYVESGSPALTDVTFTANTGSKGAGMYVAAGSPTLTNVAFSGNIAGDGSKEGVGMYVASGNLTLTNVTFSGHSGGFYGGSGMYVADGTVVMTGGRFYNNTLSYTSTNGGGAGMAIHGGSVTLTGVVFDQNGGSIGEALMLQSGNASLTNVIFSGNYGQSAGGLHVRSGTATLTNVTFSNNTTYSGAGALAAITGSVTMTNSIVWGNSNPQLYVATTSGATISYSDIQGGCLPSASITCGAGNLNGDPLFVNASDPSGTDDVYGTLDDGLRLQAGSPVVDTGSNATVVGVTTDLAGSARTVNGTVDMGAYEMPASAAAGVIYVNGSVVGGAGNGTSWTNAFADLQSALAVANPAPGGTIEIWVAAGIYKPTALASRESTFTLKDGVAVYGGFNGDETSRSARNWTTHVTTLSGEIGGVGIADNSSHVVTVPSGVTSSSVLDGFTITAGNANDFNHPGGGLNNLGGSPTLSHLTFSGNNGTNGAGMYSAGGSPVLRGVTFTGNTATNLGGGMYVYRGSPKLATVTFSGNTAQASGWPTGGGGMWVDGGSPLLTDVIFENNRAQGGQSVGGGLAVATNTATASATLVNVAFTGNSAVTQGGGLALGFMGGAYGGTAGLTNVSFINNSAGNCADYTGYGGGLNVSEFTAVVTNATFSGNSACYGGAVALPYNISTTINNSILWGNTVNTGGQAPEVLAPEVYVAGSFTARYSIVKGRENDPDNHVYGDSAHDPKFVSASDLHLQSGSPAIDAGSNSYSVDIADMNRDGSMGDPLPFDLERQPRFVNGIVDLGAFEYQGTSDVSAPVVMVGSVSGSGGVDDSAPFALSTSTNPTVVWSANESGSYAIKLGADCASGTLAAGTSTNSSGSYTVGQSVSSTVDLSSLTDGAYTVLVCVTDTHANTGYSSAAITRDTVLPVVSLVSPANGNSSTDTTPTFSGTAGTAAGDSTTVTIKLYSGSAASGTPVLTLSPAVGTAGAYSVDASSAVAFGTYTAQAEQKDAAGNTGFSVSTTFTVTDAPGGIIYVNDDASGTNSGTSWTNAYTSLQSALAMASSGKQIWVAGGTYKPSSPAGRDATFALKNGVAVYGGFAGTEGSLGERNLTLTANASTLSGDLNSNGRDGYDSYHVVSADGTVTSSAIFDGFTISGGNANNADNNFRGNGGGFLASNGGSPTLANLRLTGNAASRGGGAYFMESTSTLSNITLVSNTAVDGGGMAQVGGSVTLTDVTFSNNSSTVNDWLQGGGGLYVFSGSATLVRATFTGNTTGGYGGGLGSAGSVTLTGATFTGNSAKYGGGMEVDAGAATLTNVAFSGNTAAGGQVYGGGMNVWNGSATLTNVVFSGNSVNSGNSASFAWGGGMSNRGTATLTNVTFYNNSVTAGSNSYSSGGGFYNFATGASATLTNSILWGNTAPHSDATKRQIDGGAVTYSIVQNGRSGTGNLDVDPLFINSADPDGDDNRLGTADDGLRLQSTSPAIDAGDNSVVTATTDLIGNARKVGTVDMGAYEYQGAAAVPDLTITKSHTGNFTQGQTGATYTITVRNLGTAATSGAVTVTDTLPTGLTATAMSGTDWTCALGTLSCTRSDALEVSASYPAITLTVSVASNAAASVTNTVAVSGGGETNTSNSTTTDVTSIVAGNPVPAITSVSPPSLVVGATDRTITLAGTGFVTGAKVHWYEPEASPAYSVDVTPSSISSTQIVFSAPDRIGVAKTVELTVVNPTPGGGTSNVQPFLVTPTGASVSNTNTGTSGTAQISGVVAAAATGGTGTVYVAQYGGNPAGSPGGAFTASGSYVDVYLASGSSYNSVDIQVCDSSFSSASRLYWWNGSAWAQVSPAANFSPPCLTFTATATSTPSIIQLTGTPFVGGTPDTTGPTVVSVGAVTPDPRNTAVTSVNVVMSEAVDLSTFTPADLSLARDGVSVSLTGVTISPVSGATYTIDGLSTTTALDGSYTLTVTASGIKDPAGNSGSGTGSDSWVKDSVAPTVTSISRYNPLNAVTDLGSVTFQVIFSEPVSGVETSDFTLAATGISDASITSPIGGSGTTYRVTASTGKGDGVIRLDLTDDNSIADDAGNPLGGTGQQNFTTGESYTIDRSDPRVTITRLWGSGGEDTNGADGFAVVTNSGASITWSANENGAYSVVVAGDCSGAAYSSSYTAPGSVISPVASGSLAEGANTVLVCFKDSILNPTSASVSVTKDAILPTVMSVGPVTPDPRKTAVDSVDVLMSEPVNLSTFDYNDLSLTLNGGSNLITSISGVTVSPSSGSTYTIAGLSGLTGTDGTYVLAVIPSGIQDPGGNAGTGGGSDSWVMDATSPTTSITSPSAGSTIGWPSVYVSASGQDAGSGLASLLLQIKATTASAWIDIDTACAFSNLTTPQTCARTASGLVTGTTYQVRSIAKDTVGNQTTSQTVSFAVGKATATVTLDAASLSQTYDGTAKSVTATTNPIGLTVVFSYSGTANDGTTYGPSTTGPTKAGSYSVTGTIDDANYQGSASGSLTVGKATATVTLDAASLSQTYDGTAKSVTATTNPIGLTVVSYSYSQGGIAVTSAINAGSYGVVASLNNPNYQSSDATGALVIGKANASVTADEKTKTYGDANPALTATVVGQVPGGDAIHYSLSTAAVNCSDVGDYPITVTLGANPNYNVTPTDGKLTVGKKVASVTADNKTKSYSADNPALTATVDGEVASCAAINYSLSTTAEKLSSAGDYPITVTLGDNPNYNVSATNGTLKIQKVTLTVTATNQTAQYSDPFTGVFTFNYSGWVNGEGPSVLTTEPTCSTTRLLLDRVGSYPITCSGGVDENYGFTYVAGSLTVGLEDAKVRFHGGNPVAVKVTEDGGASGPFSLTAFVSEVVPELSWGGLPGDISLANLSMQLVSVGPGGAIAGVDCSTFVEGTGYDARKSITCNFDKVAVNTYAVQVTVDGFYYRAQMGEDVVGVYDPSLGYAVGAGYFNWNGTTTEPYDTHFSFTMRYNKSGANLQGTFMLTRTDAEGNVIYRVKSNALTTLSLSKPTATGFGWATFSGKANYVGPDQPLGSGNYTFTVYVEDQNLPGPGVDEFWVELKDKAGNVVENLHMETPAEVNAVDVFQVVTLDGSVTGSNIFVPHVAGSIVTPTATPAPTGTPTPVPTTSVTPTPQPTGTPAPTSTPGPTASPTPTSTPQPTGTPAPTSTPKPTVDPTPTSTPKPTVSPSPTSTATPVPSATPTVTPKPTRTRK